METNLYNYITLAAPTTTTVTAKASVLTSITVNKAAANGVITVYDGEAVAGGTVIAIITSPGTLLQNHFTLNYNICLSKGLTIVTSTAAQDITVAYRVIGS